MAKSFKEIMNTPVIDILKTPVDTDMSAEGFRRAFGITKPRRKEDMSKRITEGGVDYSKMSRTADSKKPKTVKVTKKEVSVETPTGNIGAASGEIGPDMGRVNREAPVIDMSTQASPEDVARIKGEDRVDMHEQARRMMGFGSYKKGGAVKKKAGGCGMKKGGAVKASGASKRADGCAQRGKTRGRMV